MQVFAKIMFMSAPVYRSVSHCGFFARPGPSTDSDATGLLQYMDSSMGRQSVSLARCLASCGLQLVWFCCFLAPAVLKTRFAGCYCEGNFQAVLARSSVSSWVGSALPDPVYFTLVSSIVGRSHLRSAVTGTCVCAWIADVDNWTSGVRRLLSVGMELSPGLSSWSRAQSFDFQTSTQESRLI